MSESRPNVDDLHEIGENTTNVANAWAGAHDYVSRGLKAWTRIQIGADQKTAVSAAVAACALVTDSYPIDDPAVRAPRRYIDDMLAAIRGWLADPSRDNQERVRSMLDVTRDRHAWQDDHDFDHFWTLEAIDHASLAVWSGERSSYIVPLDYATSAARSVACVFHALQTRGESKQAAVEAVVGAVLAATRRGA